MSRELSRLESALRATSPRAPESVREQAIARAMAAFDRHHREASEAERHRGEAPRRGTPWMRRLATLLPRPPLALAGSVAVVALAGIVSHQVLVGPQAPPADVAAPASREAPPGAPARALDAAPEMAETERASVAKSIERALEPERDEEFAEAVARAIGEGGTGGLHSLRGPVVGSTEQRWSSPPLEREPGMRRSHARDRDRSAEPVPGPAKVVAEEPVSTFPIEVDTGSYDWVRASLLAGHLPEEDAVRTEALVNRFSYDYAPPETRDPPFATHVTVTPAPWNDAARLLHIGIQGYALDRSAAPPTNLVFLVDNSDSMKEQGKLPLFALSFSRLIDELSPEDRLAMVTYGGTPGVVLAPTTVADSATIFARTWHIHEGGPTAGEGAIRDAYRLAGQHFVEGGVNRVVLVTGGDFDAGISDPQALEAYIARKRESGVSLSVLGFGTGDRDDAPMRRLARSGGGNAVHVDSRAQAHRVLLQEATSVPVIIARDVTIEVEFNPAVVGAYRLIGHEPRMPAHAGVRDDGADARAIVAGHAVTAIYELVPADSGARRTPAPRDGNEGAVPTTGLAGEYAYLAIRYRLPGAERSTVLPRAVTAADAVERMDAASRDVRFAVAAAAFGELLRGGRHAGAYGYDDVIALADGARGADPLGERQEFVRLVRLAGSIAAAAVER